MTRRFSVDLANKTLDFNLTVPVVRVKGRYRAENEFLGVNYNSNGNFTSTIGECSV